LGGPPKTSASQGTRTALGEVEHTVDECSTGTFTIDMFSQDMMMMMRMTMTMTTTTTMMMMIDDR
jgi:hypothetical protein